ncbi:3-carboxy-cis,cis-muconate cycloisomerase [Kribbella koreensis]|uniref:3-carboxy-cis,cis-muconate cycloisomerase n=1 Tax=Kribbella koreensis TaxID=57909 RepID=A0ABN1RDB2_9ACTN
MSATGRPELPGGDFGLLSPVWAGSRAESLTGDTALVRSMVAAEAALIRALIQVGLAPTSAEEVAAQVEAALIEPAHSIDPAQLALEAVAGGNPVIPLVERLRESAGVGDETRWIHFGATSQDIVDTALMLVATDVLEVVLEDLEAIVGRLTGLAVRYRDFPVVARTLGQQALPTTLGLRVAGWLTGTRDAVQSIQALLPLPASLGGPVGTAQVYGADGPLVLDAFASRLGLSAPTLSWHTRRGPVLGLANALVAVGAAVGKIAADVLVMSQTEIGEVREATGGTSSSMAHKSNPTRSVLIASAARQLPALGAIIGASAVAEQERPAGAWHAEWQPLRDMLRLAGGATALARDLIDGLVFDQEALARNLDLLRSTLGGSETWTTPHLKPAAVWVDRALKSDRGPASDPDRGEAGR